MKVFEANLNRGKMGLEQSGERVMAQDFSDNLAGKEQPPVSDVLQAQADALRQTIKQKRAARTTDAPDGQSGRPVEDSTIPTLTDVVSAPASKSATVTVPSAAALDAATPVAAAPDAAANVSPAVWRVHPDRLAAQQRRAAAEANDVSVTTGVNTVAKDTAVRDGALPISPGTPTSNDGVKMTDATSSPDTSATNPAPKEADTIPQGFRLALRPDYSWDAVQKLRTETEANPGDWKKGADLVIALNGHAEEKKQAQSAGTPNALQKIEPGTILNAIQKIEGEEHRLAALYRGRSLASTKPDAETNDADRNAIVRYKPFEMIPFEGTRAQRSKPGDDITDGEFYPIVKYKPFPVIPFTKTTYSWQQQQPAANFTSAPSTDSAPETTRSAPVDNEPVKLREEIDPLKQYGGGRDSINGNGNKYNVLGDGNTVTYNFGGDPKLKELLEKTRAELERANGTPSGLTPTTGTAGSNGGAFGAPSWHNQATWLENNTSSLGLGGWLTVGTVVASALGAPVLPLAWMFGGTTTLGVWKGNSEHMQRLKWLHEESVQEREMAHKERLAALKSDKDKKPALSAADVVANGDINVPGGAAAGRKAKETTDDTGADLGAAGGGKRGGARSRRPTTPAAAMR
jgi:hypothetical protein